MFEAKKPIVREKQLKVQSLYLPFSIVGNATPASVAVTRDDPAILFIRTEGTDSITEAAGALDAGETDPSFATEVDANGVFSLLVKIEEAIHKVVAAKIIRRNGQEVISCSMADTDGISANGDKIVLNADSGVDLSAATLDAALEVHYIVSE